MKKTPNLTEYEQPSEPDMRSEYDFRGGVRGKYAQRFAGGIKRDMIPEHAREEWDAEVSADENLHSQSKPKQK